MTLPADNPLSFPSNELPTPAASASSASPAVTPPLTPAASPYHAPTSRLSKAALFSFILSVVPIVPLVGNIFALILGFVGFKRIARSNGALHGKGFAITGIIFSSLVLLLIPLLIAVAVIVPAMSSHSRTLPAPVVEPDARNIEIEAGITGSIIYLVPEGQEVSAGDVLVRLDDRMPHARLTQIEAEIAAADAASDTARLEQERDATKVLIEQCTIRANDAGRVERVDVAVGQTVRPGQTLLSIKSATR